MIKRPRGYVYITTSLCLEKVADVVSRALNVNLRKAPIGRFEEYEGYEGEAMGFTIYLLGDDLSKPRPTIHTYELSIRPSHYLARREAISFEEVDMSSFLAWVLMSRVPELEVSTTPMRPSSD